MWGLSSTKRVKDFLITSCDFQQCLRYNDITIFLEILDCSSRILYSLICIAHKYCDIVIPQSLTKVEGQDEEVYRQCGKILISQDF